MLCVNCLKIIEPDKEICVSGTNFCQSCWKAKKGTEKWSKVLTILKEILMVIFFLLLIIFGIKEQFFGDEEKYKEDIKEIREIVEELRDELLTKGNNKDK
jgi:hypothetical protein